MRGQRERPRRASSYSRVGGEGGGAGFASLRGLLRVTVGVGADLGVAGGEGGREVTGTERVAMGGGLRRYCESAKARWTAGV